MSTAAVLKLDGGTSVRVIVTRTDKNPQQLDLFEDHQTAWSHEMMTLAKKMPSPFFFSELRMMAAHEPPSASWWGALTKTMRKHGLTQTGTFRRSPRESRRGGVDFQWQRN